MLLLQTCVAHDPTLRQAKPENKGGALGEVDRGKFFKPNAQMNLPVYLEADVLDYFKAKAQATGVELNVMINDLLKKDIALI